MSDPIRSVRPSVDALQALPTIETESPDEGVVWELKKVTDDTKYWLCTQGTGGPSGKCTAYKAGRVIAESLATGEMPDYGPENIRELQGIDFIHRLTDEIEVLERDQKAEFTWERQKQIDEARRHRDQTMASKGLKPVVIKDPDADVT
jgi:hypothetical protein